jgi:hypothetical protein
VGAVAEAFAAPAVLFVKPFLSKSSIIGCCPWLKKLFNVIGVAPLFSVLWRLWQVLKSYAQSAGNLM